MEFNHFNSNGQAHMVDVSAKQPTMRTAVAEAIVQMSDKLLDTIFDSKLAKGDVLGVARLAGISAVKKTPDLIPLSHPLAIHHVSIEFESDRTAGDIKAICTVKAFERTGVEMEAMTGAAIAALTIYDMVKGADKGVAIGSIRLMYKEGGKSGVYERKT